MRYRAWKTAELLLKGVKGYSRGTEGKAVPTSYVHSGHDFCRDSVKLIQASLTLTAPKIPGSNAAKLLVQGHVHSGHDYLFKQLFSVSPVSLFVSRWRAGD